MNEILQPKDWSAPIGYSNGIRARGTMVFVAGQVGWDAEGNIVGDSFVEQAAQALRNVVTVLAEGGARPEHVVRMTWYVTDLDAYRQSMREVGKAYREIMDNRYSAMTLVKVAGLVEEGAIVEIEATAVIPEEE